VSERNGPPRPTDSTPRPTDTETSLGLSPLPHPPPPPRGGGPPPGAVVAGRRIAGRARALAARQGALGALGGAAGGVLALGLALQLLGTLETGDAQ
jgi:predicted lipid-binding transport protein (Tim44 family)